MLNILLIRKHQPSGNLRQRIDRPRILSRIDRLDQILISRYRISQTQSRSSEKLRSTAKNDQIRIIIRQRNTRHFFLLRRKLHIRLIDHHENSILQTGIEDPAHLAAGDCGGSRIVRVTEHQKFQLIRQMLAEVFHIHMEPIFFF